MKKLLTLLLTVLTISCYEIDRDYKHIVNTWQLETINDIEYWDIHQWCFDKDGTFFFAEDGEISEDFEYTISDFELCLYVSETECFDVLELTKKSLIVERRDYPVIYKFRALD